MQPHRWSAQAWRSTTGAWLWLHDFVRSHWKAGPNCSDTKARKESYRQAREELRGKGHLLLSQGTWVLFPAPTRGLTTTYNFSSQGSVFFCPLPTSHSHAHTLTHTHTWKEKSKRVLGQRFLRNTDTKPDVPAAESITMCVYMLQKKSLNKGLGTEVPGTWKGRSVWPRGWKEEWLSSNSGGECDEASSSYRVKCCLQTQMEAIQSSCQV